MRSETLKDKAYKYIKDKIISCEYAPGDFLDEKVLIEEINSSRTPIREALNKIEQENLIQIIPKKGVVVKQISLKNIWDIYQVRDLVEPNTIRLYGSSYERKKLIEFRNIFANKSLKPIEFFKADDIFHAYIIEAYKNDYITNLMADVRVQNQRLRILAGKSNDIGSAHSEHIQIINYLLDNKYESAAIQMKNHIELAKNRTLDVITKK